jgi:hypothetical protein
MQEQEHLLSVPGNVGKESKGVAFGLEGNLAFPIILGGLVGFIVFQAMVSETQAPFGLILLIAATPGFMAFVIVFLFFKGKPPHYLIDLLAETFASSAIERAPKQPEHPEQTTRQAMAKKG